MFIGEYQNSIDSLILELEKYPKNDVQLSLLLSCLRAKSATLQDEIAEAVPKEEMRIKSKLSQKLKLMVAYSSLANQLFLGMRT